MKTSIFSIIIIVLMTVSSIPNNVSAMYCPDTGRFLQRDPLGVRDEIGLVNFIEIGTPVFPRKLIINNQYQEGMNLYEYVRSNTVNLVDPFGLSTLCGKLKMNCKCKPVSWPVYGDSERAKFILAGKEGCVTLLIPKAIFCTGSCKDIKDPSYKSAGGVQILNHEACHACAYEEGWLFGYTWTWIPGDITGYCDKHAISSTPGW